ncbi:single-stranded DNA-binding protein [Salinimicrobium sp. TH3]|uniref:single-stranded DNA-binding protein n=1 Tax=Salinimicrobium sp. TH3 TaxID=2997342 RepID=UPI0022731659|nr:single-stranded DNA-binding protein [Salinimicrobium sp. TH3]MCY2686264.1 single-stranded DNA-binding protein [Salinimicrobium sp. TH3]
MTGTLNKVMLIGHTGDDVKMHYFEGGGSIGRFPLATNEVYTNKTTGQKVENTEWHNIVVRNKAAEICEKYLKKGDKVYIEGRIKTRKWQDDKGVERYSTEIQCTDFTFLTPKDATGSGSSSGAGYGQSQSQSQGQQQNEPQQKAPSSQPQSFTQEDEDDLPF